MRIERIERLEEWLDADSAARNRALQASLERINQLDPVIKAWVEVRPESPAGGGPLAMIPFGIKDVIDTTDLVTEYGSPLYTGRHAQADAAIVRQLRERGAIILGKTHAAAFAYRSPPPTRNPRNLGHTPGGSSSGSAAAVAAGMVPVTVGTQTLGSMLRPASFCGVTGFKPTYGLMPLDGVLPVAPSLDTLGFFTRTPVGMLRLWNALGQPTAEDEEIRFGVVDPMPEVDAEMAAAFEATIAHLRACGVRVESAPITTLLRALGDEAKVVMAYEAAQVHAERYEEHGARLLDLADLIREGRATPDGRYRSALAFIADAKQRMADQFTNTPVILSPAAPGPAPKGLGSTGDARMNSSWTALGTPAISVPMRVGGGLPLGLQLSAAGGDDGRVLAAAVRIWSVIVAVR